MKRPVLWILTLLVGLGLIGVVSSATGFRARGVRAVQDSFSGPRGGRIDGACELRPASMIAGRHWQLHHQQQPQPALGAGAWPGARLPAAAAGRQQRRGGRTSTTTASSSAACGTTRQQAPGALGAERGRRLRRAIAVQQREHHGRRVERLRRGHRAPHDDACRRRSGDRDGGRRALCAWRRLPGAERLRFQRAAGRHQQRRRHRRREVPAARQQQLQHRHAAWLYRRRVRGNQRPGPYQRHRRQQRRPDSVC